jgi:hypothetical protein
MTGAEEFPKQDLLPVIAALSIMASVYFKVDAKARAESAAPSQKSHQFKVGDTVRLVKKSATQPASSVAEASALTATPPASSSVSISKASSATSQTASSGRQSKVTGTVLQVKSTRCVVRGLTGRKISSFRHEQLELVDSARVVIPTLMHSVTVTAANMAHESLLLEIQHTVLTQIWQYVSASRISESCHEQCSHDRRVLCEFAGIFEATNSMHTVIMSVSPALLFLRLFSFLSSFFDQSVDHEMIDPEAIQAISLLRSSLRDVLSFFPRILDLLPEKAFVRAVAALLFFLVRGSCDGASCASRHLLQLSASILNIIQDQIQQFWPAVIEFMYSTSHMQQHDAIGDLVLLSACKEFDMSSNDKYSRVFESQHPYDSGCSNRHEISFPGAN